MLYWVTWGDEAKVLEAGNEADAWALFCELVDNARKHPNRCQRVIEAFVPPAPEAPAEVVPEPESPTTDDE